jgi:hypothetical protein
MFNTCMRHVSNNKLKKVFCFFWDSNFLLTDCNEATSICLLSICFTDLSITFFTGTCTWNYTESKGLQTAVLEEFSELQLHYFS